MSHLPHRYHSHCVCTSVGHRLSLWSCHSLLLQLLTSLATNRLSRRVLSFEDKTATTSIKEFTGIMRDGFTHTISYKGPMFTLIRSFQENT